MTENGNPAASDDLHWERADALAQRVRLAIRPLCFIQGKRLPRLVGNSVLLSVANRRFILTAAHVLDEFGTAIHIFSPPTYGGLTGGHHCNRYPSRPDREDDPLDAGVFAQTFRAEVPELEGHYLTVDQIDVDSRPQEDQPHLMVGFPESRSKRVINGASVPKWMTYTANETSHATYRERGFHPISNLLLDFDIVRARQPDGKEVRAPSFRGVSGTGIWRFASLSHPSQAANDKLVAIFTGYRDGILFGTRLSIHVELIRTHYPELSASLPRFTTWRIQMKPGRSIDASTLDRSL